ncbi:site-specific DNA-methyltransferase [Patescibacteria group bacterium]|nr:site-specific DNA-methyltransferase [Patescibacteria group bacterium]MBU4512378.1 site-specific DNA-methyltransferase [Patescibacteria group bacterium]MCG2692487.1 site-specific DNA-methyltransferase [Candidatus Parcubacteria bacterium]
MKPCKIIEKFNKIKVDKPWAFADKTRKQTAYLTHGYHRYPAKFIPQIVSRLNKKYTKKGDLIVDPFGGCGTTSVESKVMGRPSISVDINPVAVLIAKAKATAIEPLKLEKEFIDFKYQIGNYTPKIEVKTPKHERIDYWFKPEEKRKLAYIFTEISKIKNRDIRDFFYCGFSNILKNCSIWLQKSNKPTRDFKKKLPDPFRVFLRQIKAMLKGNAEFYNLLRERGFLNVLCKVHCADARAIPTKNNSVALIVTSPPYVTSYEYADLHQLTALWFEYTKNLSDFRKRFIGTSHNGVKDVILNSQIAEKIKQDLEIKNKKLSKEVSIYFSEMNQCFKEMKRILKKGGRTCIVIGNTSLKGVEILNAEVFVEQMQNLGLKIDDIIKREIPSKNLPSARDKKTGRFSKADDKNKTYVYPTEYILIMKKL